MGADGCWWVLILDDLENDVRTGAFPHDGDENVDAAGHDAHD